MDKEKEKILKTRYRKEVLSYVSDTVTICNRYKQYVPDDIQDAFARLKNDAKEVVTKILKSNVESWKT